MSEGSGDSWDSPSSENFARQGGSQGRAAGETGGYRPPGRPPGPPDGLPDQRAQRGRGGDLGGTDPAQVHAWYTSGMELLGNGSPAAAAQVLQRAADAEPGSRSVREALARAQFDTGQYTAAAGNFRRIVEASPTDDYAHFGLGLSLARAGNHAAAAEYLALAAAMRPDRKHYTDALHQVRATLKFRGQSTGAQPQPPLPPG
jgi:predicted Zn-dependent protease